MGKDAGLSVSVALHLSTEYQGAFVQAVSAQEKGTCPYLDGQSRMFFAKGCRSKKSLLFLLVIPCFFDRIFALFN